MSSPNRTGQSVGRYQLGDPLGRGGMAEVYRATDTSLGRSVAVKLILPHYAGESDFRERFLREARLVAALSHPHILPVYDFGEQEGTAYLVMPLLEGGTLSDQMTGSAFPLAQVVDWAAQLAGALDAAHAEGILHRDVKPSNVLVGRDGRLALADFGIAKSAEASTKLTTTGAVVGTPSYMAPELARGETASPASDLYALGVLVYELLSGDPPFRGDSALAVLHRHVTEPVPPITRKVPTLPAALDGVLSRVLAKEPAARQRSCSEFAEDLAEAAGLGPTRPIARLASSSRPAAAMAVAPTVVTPTSGLGRAAAPAVGRAAAAAPSRSLAGWWTAGVLAVLAAAIGAYLGLRPAPGASRPTTEAASVAAASSPLSASVEGRVPSPTPETPRSATTPAVQTPPAVPVPRPTTVGEPAKEPIIAAPAATIEPATLEPAVAKPPAGTLLDAAVAPVARALASVRRAGERAAGMLRPTRRLDVSDFRETLSALAELGVAPTHAEADPGAAAALHAFSRGGLAWVGGDVEAARRELDQAASKLGSSLTPLANPALVLRAGALDSRQPWQLAFAFGDPRKDAANLLAEAQRQGTASAAQVEFGAAVVARWEGRHAEAARQAQQLLEASGSSLSAAERSQIAQFAAEELSILADLDGAARLFDRALAEGGEQRGPLAFEAAVVLGARAGRRDLATRYFEVACAAGIERVCPEPSSPGERRGPPFIRRRPRGAAGG